MKTITATELRGNIFNLLDEVLESGVPLEIEKNGRKLRITSIEKVDKLANLVHRPNFIKGDPEELVEMEWDYNLDLP